MFALKTWVWHLRCVTPNAQGFVVEILSIHNVSGCMLSSSCYGDLGTQNADGPISPYVMLASWAWYCMRQLQALGVSTCQDPRTWSAANSIRVFTAGSSGGLKNHQNMVPFEREDNSLDGRG